MKFVRSVAFASVSLMALATPTFAQEAVEAPEATADAEPMNEIIVQARRRDEGLQDVPLVVNAVTAETIDKLNLRSFSEISSVVPGLQLTPTPNGIGSATSMRGVNHDVNVSAENGTVQYYRNDAPVPSAFVFQTMYDVGQIEVLRGPQGTLRGRATPSGSITLTTHKPDLSEVGGYASGTFGSGAVANLNGAMNIPVIEDMLAVRVAGLYKFDRGNRVRSINSDVDPRSETEAIRAAVRFEPTDWLRFGFLYEGMHNEGRRFDQVRSASEYDPDYVPSANAPDYGTISLDDRLSVQNRPHLTAQTFKFYNWNAEADILGQKLVYVGSRTSQHYQSNAVRDLGNFFPDAEAGLITDTRGTTTSHEVRLQNIDRIAGMFDYVIGYFRYHLPARTILADRSLSRNVVGGSQVGPVSVREIPIFLPMSDPTEESFFGNVTVHLGEATELSGGLRRLHFTDSQDGMFINCTPETYQAGTCTRQSGTDQHVKENATIYSASIKHRFNDNIMAYASTGSSWRPPVLAIGNFTRAAYTPNELAHIKLPPETSKSYEVGIKTEWFDRKLTFNLTGYHQKFKNYPYRGGGITYININAAGAPAVGSFDFVSAVPVKVNGVEAELSFTPSSNFSFGASVNYAKSKLGNALLACTDALNNQTGAVGSDGIPDTTTPELQQMIDAYGSERVAVCQGGGQSATFQPKLSGAVQAEYNRPVTDSMDGYLRGLLSWRGKSETDPNNRFDDVGAYGIFNLYGGLRAADGAWEVSLYAKNIFDTTKLVNQDDVPQFTSTSDILLNNSFQFVGLGSTSFNSRYTGVIVTPPREVGVTFRLAFGSR